jgi:hypothetical protein
VRPRPAQLRLHNIFRQYEAPEISGDAVIGIVAAQDGVDFTGLVIDFIMPYSPHQLLQRQEAALYKTRALADIPLVWMARQAEAVGLSFDWTCLPDPTKLNHKAPKHDSSSGLFALDRYHPMLREIGMKKARPCKRAGHNI